MLAATSHQGRAYPADATCNAPACRRRPKVRGLCRKHYQRVKDGGTLSYEAQSVENLRQIRASFGLSQRALARECGISKRAIYHMEKGGAANYGTIRKLHIGIRRLQREKVEQMARRAV